MNKQVNITPIRMIRVLKDLSQEEMAKLFLVTKAHISAIEKKGRKFKTQTLKFGLDNMNITLEDYYILEGFSEGLLSQDLTDKEKYKFMLIKTLGVIEPETRAETDEILNKLYYSRIKKNR